jgi:hypothetical protein
LPSLLAGLIPRPALQAEMERLSSVRGDAEGHLSISGPLHDVAVEVTVSRFNVTAEYDRLPAVFNATGAGVTVTNTGIALKQGHVNLDHSSVQGLSGQLTWSDPVGIDIQATGAQLDWDGLYPSFAGMAVWRERFTEIEHVGGRMNLAGTRLKGSLSDAAQWHFVTSGTVSGLSVRHAKLPAMLSLPAGRFAVQPERLTFSDLRLFMLDLDIEADLQIEGYRAARPRTQMSGRGVIGDAAAVWLHGILDVPKELYIRAPIGINRIQIDHQMATPTRVQGEFHLPGDLKIGGDLRFGPNLLDIERLSLSDARSDARMALRYNASRRTWQGVYEGLLESTTMARLWRNSPVFAQRIEGDITALVSAENPADAQVQGQIKASNLIWDNSPWGELIIRRLDMQAEQKTIRIRQLDFGVEEQRASLTGKADMHEQGISLDLAVTAHNLNASRLEQAFRPAPGQNAPASGNDSLWPEWTARIDLAVDRLEYGAYTVQPLHAVLTLSKDRVEMQVTQAATCGIFMHGDVRWTPEELWMEIVPQAKGQPLQVAVGCLTGAPTTERIEGTYEIDGRVTTRGNTTEELTRNLKGTVNFNAVDGRIFNAGSVGIFSNLLSFLQINNLITGDLPGLSGDDFLYNRILLALEFDQGYAEIIEADVFSEGLNMVGEGRINMLNQRLELTVLVSPLTTVDSIIRRIPVVGRILKGTLVAIPVGVKGSLSNPRITPLTPRSVGTRLLGILERTLKAPFRLIEPILQPWEAPQEPVQD